MPTNFVDDIMQDVCSNGLNDDLRQLAEDDAKLLKQLDVLNERERNLVFYLDHFLDELCEEFRILPAIDRTKVITNAFMELRNVENVDLTDIRKAIYHAIKGNRKLAYPNTMGVMESNMKPRHNIDRWIKTLGEIQIAEHLGQNKHNVMRQLTEEWDPVEKLDFQQWFRYYEKGDHEKYAKLSATAAEQVLPTTPTSVPQVPFTTSFRGPKTRSLEENRQSLISRLDSAKRLLRLFAPPIWPRDRWDSIYGAISDLEKEIISLRTVSSIQDRIVRTANILAKKGFQEGANTLYKIAQPATEDVASQIEKALTGREYDTKSSPTETLPTGDMGMPPPEVGIPSDMSMPPAEGTPPPIPPAPEAMPGALETLPEPPPLPPIEEETKPAKDENPYAGSTTKDILDVLDPLMKRFKEREIVRQLSKVDMMMDALNIVAYFPELGEAIGRLLETDSYVGTRLEKIIGKLRGGLREEEDKKEKPSPPNIEMEPQPKIPEKRPEETAVEVGEKPPKLPEQTSVEVSEKPGE